MIGSSSAATATARRSRAGRTRRRSASARPGPARRRRTGSGTGRSRRPGTARRAGRRRRQARRCRSKPTRPTLRASGASGWSALGAESGRCCSPRPRGSRGRWGVATRGPRGDLALAELGRQRRRFGPDPLRPSMVQNSICRRNPAVSQDQTPIQNTCENSSLDVDREQVGDQPEEDGVGCHEQPAEHQHQRDARSAGRAAPRAHAGASRCGNLLPANVVEGQHQHAAAARESRPRAAPERTGQPADARPTASGSVRRQPERQQTASTLTASITCESRRRSRRRTRRPPPPASAPRQHRQLAPARSAGQHAEHDQRRARAGHSGPRERPEQEIAEQAQQRSAARASSPSRVRRARSLQVSGQQSRQEMPAGAQRRVRPGRTRHVAVRS